MTVSLVTNFGNLCHISTCYTVRRARGVRGLAPEIDVAAIIDFCRARKIDPCGGCLREVRDQLVAEKVVAHG